MADRSIFYRRKTPQGAWTRAVGTRPFTISGLVGGEVYEVDDGTGVIQEAAALTAQATTHTIATSDGYSGTITPNGADWDVFMTGPSGSNTITLTDADLNSDVAHNVVPPEITEGPTGTYMATDNGGWFWKTSLADVIEFSARWFLDGVQKGGGLTYTKTESVEDHLEIKYRVVPNFGNAAETIAQAEAAFTPNAVRANAGSANYGIEFPDEGVLSDNYVFAASFTVPADTAGGTSIVALWNGPGSECYLSITKDASGVDAYFFLYDEANPTPLTNIARVDNMAVGVTYAFVVTAEIGGAVRFACVSDTGVLISTSTTLPTGLKLNLDGPLRVRNGNFTSELGPVWHRVAQWAPASVPGDVVELRNRLFDADTALPRSPLISNAILGTPLNDAYRTAASWNAGTNDGSLGAATVLAGTVFSNWNA